MRLGQHQGALGRDLGAHHLDGLKAQLAAQIERGIFAWADQLGEAAVAGQQPALVVLNDGFEEE
jgi:hypothetical protein